MNKHWSHARTITLRAGHEVRTKSTKYCCTCNCSWTATTCPEGEICRATGVLVLIWRKTAPVMAQLTQNVDIFKFSKDFRSGRNPKGLNLYVPRRKSNDLSSARPGEFRHAVSVSGFQSCQGLLEHLSDQSVRCKSRDIARSCPAVLLSCCPASQVLTCEASGELDTFLTQHRPSARESELRKIYSWNLWAWTG